VGKIRKRIARKSEWLQAEGVVDIYSVSNCISHDFAHYINDLRDNSYWLFDSPGIIDEDSQTDRIDLTGTKLFYFERGLFNDSEPGPYRIFAGYSLPAD